METTALKRFAAQARTIIRKGVEKSLEKLGFNEDGIPTAQPRLIQGATLFMEQQYEESFYHQWRALESAMQHGREAVIEEAAYTWFNRFMAIQILHKNEFIEPVLSFPNANIRVPHIVNEARAGRFGSLDETERLRLRSLLTDPTKTFEQFSLLITAFCHHTPVIQKCFGSLVDYTELLLPVDILDADGFLDMLNHTDFISDEDYRTTELLGWLYQFYISERKDEVMCKKGKYSADEIPAVTQIFTPNWIVKYMVQNTLGRIYLDNNPDQQLAEDMKYLVEQSEPTPEDAKYRFSDLKELKVIDPACGSGHILLEAFDLLYRIYTDAWYQSSEAIESIFRYNLTGIDLDTRAKQLATFALMLKACQKDRSFLDAHCLPRVYDMPEADRYTWKDTEGHLCCALQFEERLTASMNEQIVNAFTLLEDAETLGSIMKFDIDDNTRQYIERLVAAYDRDPVFEVQFKAIIASLRLILTLTDKYAAVVANPPYMACSTNDILAKYVKANYEEGKADLFAVFMLLAIDRIADKGKYGMINMHSWMFLSSFEKLRISLLENYSIDNMLHLGARTFDELSGEVVQNTAFIISKNKPTIDTCGTYYRLIAGGNCHSKECMFLEPEEIDTESIEKRTIYFPNIKQENFNKIPGCPIGYWVSDKILKVFEPENLISAKSIARSGFSTGNNEKYVRQWYEVAYKNIAFGLSSIEEFDSSKNTFIPFTKGGGFRRWYGNLEAVVDWTMPETMHRPRTTYMHLYFKPAITWNAIGSGKLSCRFYDKGFLFEHASASLFVNKGYNRNEFLAYLNSNVFQSILNVLNPTLNNGAEIVSSAPLIHLKSDINSFVCANIAISKSDWDAHETSWDFKQNELIALNSEDAYIDVMNEWANFNGVMVDLAAPQLGKLEWLVETYQTKWETKFRQLHANEEELNRQFIEIYGLQDELTPDVGMDEITILQQGEISLAQAPGSDSHRDDAILWNKNMLMQQFISYAVGCMLGRYRLDRKGLHIAHPNPTADEIAPYETQFGTYEIDDDGIMPLMTQDSPFSDNAPTRFSEFVRLALGDEWHTENLNFVESALGKTIEQYFIKDFWNDHKKRYQNRPIYWLFSSKKGAFRCIAYMHRMNRFTVQNIREKYLLRQIDYLKQRIGDFHSRAAQLTGEERKKFKQLEIELAECQEYDIRLHDLANRQIDFDLDDGVVKNYALFDDCVAKIK